MGWTSAKTRHKLLALKFWNRLCKLDNSRVTRKVFNWDRTYASKRGTWSYYVKHALSDIGCIEMFNDVRTCDTDFAKTALCNLDNITWDVDRYKSEKLRYYNLYKYEKCQEDYLHMNITRYQRSLFSQFRCGILPLEIETGRFINSPLPDRLCRVCTEAAVEDEIHFLCDCKCYSDLRSDMYALVK